MKEACSSTAPSRSRAPAALSKQTKPIPNKPSFCKYNLPHLNRAVLILGSLRTGSLNSPSMTSAVLCCVISLEREGRKRASHAENAKKEHTRTTAWLVLRHHVQWQRSFRCPQFANISTFHYVCLGSQRNTFRSDYPVSVVYLHGLCAHPYTHCAFAGFVLLAYWIVVRMHIVSGCYSVLT